MNPEETVPNFNVYKIDIEQCYTKQGVNKLRKQAHEVESHKVHIRWRSLISNKNMHQSRTIGIIYNNKSNRGVCQLEAQHSEAELHNLPIAEKVQLKLYECPIICSAKDSCELSHADYNSKR